ncbi:hypothetical protein LguiA_001794 [Lonicera macranthoides]
MTLSTNSIDFCRCPNLKTLGLPSHIDYNTISENHLQVEELGGLNTPERFYNVSNPRSDQELEEIDVKSSYGFEVDDEILKLASHINDFKYENSLVLDGEEIFSTFIIGYESSSSSNSDG